MSDYKQTLNLPKTAFPMKANLPQREPERLEKWQQEDLYQQVRVARKGCEKFILHDGPPYANGNIHLGHAVNKILKDIVVKSKTLSNYDAPYVPGWDCHGLPIELNVEKKVGKPGVKVTTADFRQACRVYADKQVNQQRDAFMRLGGLGDWHKPYLTMNYLYEANEVRAIGKILENGHLQQGFKPVHWCNDCRSALALAEVEYQDKTSLSIFVKFDLIDQDFKNKFNIGAQDDLAILIWTTTPWTLPANQAVAVNDEFPYVIVEIEVDDEQNSKQKIIIAEGLLIKLLDQLNIKSHQVLASFAGSELENILVQHPFYNERQVPIILGDHVTLESGTGAVHTAPGHGQEDYQVAKKYALKIDNPVGNDGVFLPSTPLFAGMHVTKANNAVIEVLLENNKLLHQDRIEHSYPHCWRHKTPLIFRATPQWFISMEKNGLRNKALEAVKNITWRPAWGENRITKMIENNPDWCISRQRVWGTPLVLFMHKETGELHPNTIEIIERVAQKIEQAGIQAWDDLDPTELLGEEADQYEKSQDTVDVWLDSGLSHQCVLEAREELGFPADLYFEGSDQHRGWFQSSLLSSIAITDQAPYKSAITHGFTVDEKGFKMSKSLGNTVEPDKVIKQLGADVLRLWVASADYQGEISGSNEILKRCSDVYRRVRNTAKYFLSNLHDFDPSENLLAHEHLLPLDQWAIAKALETQKDIQKCYHSYDFHLVFQAIHHFCSIEMGSFYLDIIKDRQYTMPKESIGRRSAQTALYHITHAFVRWIAPILSFTADEIWEFIPGNKSSSVFIETWYENLEALSGSNQNLLLNLSEWQKIMMIRTACNKQMEQLRAEQKLGSTLEANVTLYADQGNFELLMKLEDELRFILITSQAQVLPLDQAESKSESVAVEAEGLGGIKIAVTAVTDEKCERCWHRRADVGADPEHPTLCGRCIENIDPNGAGENRKIA